MMINFAVLGGNLTRDPQKYTFKEKEGYWCTFTLAVRESEEKTSFIDCKAYNQSAEYLCNYCKKGDRLIVSDGRLTQDTYTTQDGQKRSSVKVIAYSVIGFPKGGSRPAVQTQTEIKQPTVDTPVADDDDPDMPF